MRVGARRLSGRITPAVQVIGGLRAAWLLARGRPEGFFWAHLSSDAALRSFWAAAIGLPVFLGIRLAGAEGITPVRLAAEFIAYALAWVAFPLASLRFATAFGREAHWGPFIAAWNWANLAQYAALLAGILVGGLLPAAYAPVAGLVAFGYALWLEFYVARTALRLSAGPALALVAVDVGIGLIVAIVVGRVGVSP